MGFVNNNFSFPEQEENSRGEQFLKEANPDTFEAWAELAWPGLAIILRRYAPLASSEQIEETLLTLLQWFYYNLRRAYYSSKHQLPLWKFVRVYAKDRALRLQGSLQRQGILHLATSLPEDKTLTVDF